MDTRCCKPPPLPESNINIIHVYVYYIYMYIYISIYMYTYIYIYIYEIVYRIYTIHIIILYYTILYYIIYYIKLYYIYRESNSARRISKTLHALPLLSEVPFLPARLGFVLGGHGSQPRRLTGPQHQATLARCCDWGDWGDLG